MIVNGVWEAEVVGFAGSIFHSCASATEVSSLRTQSQSEGFWQVFLSLQPSRRLFLELCGHRTSLGLWACVHADVLGKGDWDVMRPSTWLKWFNQALNWFDGSSKLVGSLHPA